MGYSGARGTLIYEKNLKAKILRQTAFKASLKGNVRPDQISLKLIPLNRLMIGHSLTVFVLYMITFLF
jgi:hypothetical protein